MLVELWNYTILNGCREAGIHVFFEAYWIAKLHINLKFSSGYVKKRNRWN